MTIELYHSAYSTCSQKVRLVLHEKELEFESKELSFIKEEQLTPEYLKINPNGVVPSLVDNGEPITDSSCIIEYLDEMFPSNSLSPSTPLGRARMRSWLRFIEEVPTSGVRVPSFEQVFLPSLRVVKSKKSFDKSTDKRTIRQGFYGKMNQGDGFDQSEIDNSMRQLTETVVRMDKALVDSPWIMGESISLVDLCLAPLIDRISDLKMDYVWADFPRVQSWLERIQSRSSFKKAFYKGSRLSDRFEFKIARALTRNNHSKFKSGLLKIEK